MGETTTPEPITISTAQAESVKEAIVEYIEAISPYVLSVLAAALGIGLIFWVVRLFLRGARTSSR